MHDDTHPTHPDATLSSKEAAAYLGISKRTLIRWRESGRVIAHEVHTVHGPAWRYPLHLLPAPEAPPAQPAQAPVDAPVAIVAQPAPPANLGAPDVRALVERAAAAEALASYLLMRVRELEAAHAPPARTPWYKRLLGRLGR